MVDKVRERGERKGEVEVKSIHLDYCVTDGWTVEWEK